LAYTADAYQGFIDTETDRTSTNNCESSATCPDDQTDAQHCAAVELQHSAQKSCKLNED